MPSSVAGKNMASSGSGEQVTKTELLDLVMEPHGQTAEETAQLEGIVQRGETAVEVGFVPLPHGFDLALLETELTAGSRSVCGQNIDPCGLWRDFRRGRYMPRS